MYDEDPRCSGILRKVSRDITKGGLRVSVPTNSEMEEEGQALIERLELDTTLPPWYRLTERDGDSFLEVGVSADNLIREISRKPTLEMHRASNEFDKFDDPEMAYWWDANAWMSLGPNEDSIWFSSWQIVHARANHDEGNRYGTPMFSTATGPWKRVREGELDIAIRRKVRAGMRYLHVLEGASDTQIEEYRQRNKSILQDSFAAVADFFTPHKGSITAVQGDASLGEIGDVRHHISTWWLSSPVPMGLMAYGEDLNRDILQEQTDEYHSALESLSSWMGAEIVVPLLQRQWLLSGIWYESYPYELEWGTKKTISARVLREVSIALQTLRAQNMLSLETSLRVLARFIPDFDPTAEIDRIEQEAAEMGVGLPDEIGRLNQPIRMPRVGWAAEEPEDDDEDVEDEED